MQKSDKSIFIQSLILVLLPMLFGGILYYIFCPTVDFVLMIDSITKWNIHYPLCNDMGPFIVLLRSFLFDFLWAWSFSNVICLVLQDSPMKWMWALVLPIAVGIAYEGLQGLRLVSGTFDYFDIAVELVAILSSIKLNHLLSRRIKNE